MNEALGGAEARVTDALEKLRGLEKELVAAQNARDATGMEREAVTANLLQLQDEKQRGFAQVGDLEQQVTSAVVVG